MDPLVASTLTRMLRAKHYPSPSFSGPIVGVGFGPVFQIDLPDGIPGREGYALMGTERQLLEQVETLPLYQKE